MCVYSVNACALTLKLHSWHLPSQDCSSMPFTQSGIPSHRSDPAMHLSSLMHKNIPSEQFASGGGIGRKGVEEVLEVRTILGNVCAYMV